MVHLRIVTPPDLTGQVVDVLTRDSVINVIRLDGAARRPDGDVVLYLLERAGVAVVAGEAYGLSPYFRLSIATSQEILDDGVARIARAVAELR